MIKTIFQPSISRCVYLLLFSKFTHLLSIRIPKITVQMEYVGYVPNLWSDLSDHPKATSTVAAERDGNFVAVNPPILNIEIPLEQELEHLDDLNYGMEPTNIEVHDSLENGIYATYDMEYVALSAHIDRLPHGIVDKQLPGVGATTLELLSKRNSIIVAPIKILAYNKHLKTSNSFYVGSAIGSTPTPTHQDIRDYLDREDIPFKKLLVVSDSLPKVISQLTEEERNTFFLMIDEIDLHQDDANYRPNLEKVMDYYFQFPQKNRCLVSATIKEFSDPRLKEEAKFTFNWINNRRRDIKLIKTNNTHALIAKLIKNVPQDEKVFIAYNVVAPILTVIDLLDEGIRDDCAILCSDASVKSTGSYFRKLTETNSLPERINFATCSYFTGVDIEDSYHLIVVSSIEQSYTALSLDRMEQIYGRCRQPGRVLSETIVYNKSDRRCSIQGNRDKLLEKANYALYFITNVPPIPEGSEHLMEFHQSLVQSLVNATYEKVDRNADIELLRQDEQERKYAPAFFNIDYLVSKARTFNHLYWKDKIAELLSEKHNVEATEDNLPLTAKQLEIEEYYQEEQVQKRNADINAAVAGLLEADSKGRINSILINALVSQNQKHLRVFYERFRALYQYVDCETLLEHLQKGDNATSFKNLNNAVVFFALEEQHPLKLQFREMFQQRALYSSEEIRGGLSDILNYHFKGEPLAKNRYIHLFNAFFKTKRNRTTGKYFICGENPKQFAEIKKRIPVDQKLKATNRMGIPTDPYTLMF